MNEIQRYAQGGLQAIHDSNFLVVEDWQALSEMRNELQDTFEKKQMWRTETEMRISVLNDLKFPTPDSKYWQAVREQDVFFRELILLSFQYRRNNVKIQQLSRDIKAMEDELERQLLEIDLEEALFNKRHMEVAASNRVRELKLWCKIKSELSPHCEDTQNVDVHQLESYSQRFARQARSLSPHTAIEARNNLVGQMETALRHLKGKRGRRR